MQIVHQRNPSLIVKIPGVSNICLWVGWKRPVYAGLQHALPDRRMTIAFRACQVLVVPAYLHRKFEHHLCQQFTAGADFSADRF
jgi:hypothetical protein